MSKVYMMVTITNRNKRKDFQTFFKEYGLPVFLETIGRVQIPLHRITDSASNGSVFPVVTEHFSASSDHAFL